MRTHDFAVEIDVDAEIDFTLMAEDEEQATQFARDRVEKAIKKGLRSELTNGTHKLEIEVASIENADGERGF